MEKNKLDKILEECLSNTRLDCFSHLPRELSNEEVSYIAEKLYKRSSKYWFFCFIQSYPFTKEHWDQVIIPTYRDLINENPEVFKTGPRNLGIREEVLGSFKTSSNHWAISLGRGEKSFIDTTTMFRGDNLKEIREIGELDRIVVIEVTGCFLDLLSYVSGNPKRESAIRVFFLEKGTAVEDILRSSGIDVKSLWRRR